MAKAYSPIYSGATGWIVGIVENHQARPMTRQEVEEACEKLKAAENFKKSKESSRDYE